MLFLMLLMVNGSPDHALALHLLTESHELVSQFPASVHANLLHRQLTELSYLAEPAAKDLVRAWSTELFSLASELPQPERSYEQSTALSALAQIDPDSGLELLHSTRFADTGPPSAQAQFCRAVFTRMAESGGIGALPLLQQEAEELGESGQYPYAALAAAAMELANKDRGDNSEHAREILRSVFEPAFARYRQSPPLISQTISNSVRCSESLRVGYRSARSNRLCAPW